MPMENYHGPCTRRAPCYAPDSESMAFMIQHLVFGNRSSDSAPAARPALILLPSDKAFINCLTQSYHVWLSYLFTVTFGNCVKHLPSVTYVPYSVRNCLWAGEIALPVPQRVKSPEKRKPFSVQHFGHQLGFWRACSQMHSSNRRDSQL